MIIQIIIIIIIIMIKKGNSARGSNHSVQIQCMLRAQINTSKCGVPVSSVTLQ